MDKFAFSGWVFVSEEPSCPNLVDQVNKVTIVQSFFLPYILNLPNPRLVVSNQGYAYPPVSTCNKHVFVSEFVSIDRSNIINMERFNVLLVL